MPSTANQQTRLVVVESPAKARTISGYLGPGWVVEASLGHIRDLPAGAKQLPDKYKKEPWAYLGVNVDADFEPIYIVNPDRAKHVTKLRSLLKEADELYLATDEDREGEAIAWHLVEALKPKVPVRRMVFHEITRPAIEAAVANPREINRDLVDAQETRRILDRLYGYDVSQVLWKKVQRGLSAGRVQSVATRIVVERERARMAFRSAEYWDVTATLAVTPEEATSEGPRSFTATLVALDGDRIATGKDFEPTTGELKRGVDAVHLDGDGARGLAARLEGRPFTVTRVETKPYRRKPYPPFITSTLQQEAARKLRMSSAVTMRVAQRLYEEGYITYMRTDSVHLSQQAMTAARGRIRSRYGEEYLSPKPRQFATRAKGAQEAHEAIRPAGTEMRTAEELGLSGREAKLYELIWKRTVASQMADARLTQSTARIAADDAVFRASGRRIDFPGFFRAYVEGSDDPDAALEDRAEPLPALKVGDVLGLRELEALSHTTQPPARYTEASLVRTLESEGIGRPSTYASIIGTIIDRGYVEKSGTQLIPTFTAIAVTELLEKHFPTLVDTRFTARMEEQLDEIAEGEADWLPYLEQFFLGSDGLEAQVKAGEERIDPREASTIELESLPARVRIGRFGPFVEVEDGDKPVTASIPEGIAPADLTEEQVAELVRAKTEGPDVLGNHPETGEPIYVLSGRFGPYVQLGEAGENGKPKRASLPKGVTPDQVTLETAVQLLSLPRTLGEHPETGEPIQAGIGRFGPYVVHQKDFRSLGPEDDVYSVGLQRALELLAQPKRASRGAKVLRELGAHPADQEPVRIYEGRYGPYVKHGSVNASLPKGKSPEEVTMEEAVELLQQRAAKGGGKRGERKKSTTRKKSS